MGIESLLLDQDTKNRLAEAKQGGDALRKSRDWKGIAKELTEKLGTNVKFQCVFATGFLGMTGGPLDIWALVIQCKSKGFWLLSTRCELEYTLGSSEVKLFNTNRPEDEALAKRFAKELSSILKKNISV